MDDVSQASAKGAEQDKTSLPGAGPLDYELLPGFEDLFLEGSFVVDVAETPGTIRFLVHAALRPTHPWYERPAMDAHCFMGVHIFFPMLRKTTWHRRGERIYSDATGHKDLGLIDTFVAETEGGYFLEGDWGSVTIESAAPCVARIGPEPRKRHRLRRQIDAWFAGEAPHSHEEASRSSSS